ncbi:peptide-N4-(N-acetyl-beta-glucosaminyl)asparagine amidase A [Emericellopsis cladophorae]|uniref:Peptide-N4-(N-acetyl-beta-glucosaminyl)asparagine amidase A n=1 Tax=Emericellopsis cladophorae TaxID=2686198 RepID=A0A9P9Y7J5_9HYPO|nr:peptide-N4-(N-acetyl-beta-glucosaminyl)asparagine amidase A [Emericellopsis cladophorae]KAI6784440.1 peptide-N4-(N-acetyl-beta-glucosaminyl)asparagine amidase A [Emericellopsis cladophorae]
MKSRLCFSLLWFAHGVRSSTISPEDAQKSVGATLTHAARNPHWPVQHNETLECFQVTHPVETHLGLAIGDQVVRGPGQGGVRPFCTQQLVKHTFGNSYGHPFVRKFMPPACDFNKAFINVTIKSQGHQFDRLATLWLGDIEIWRTSTAEPTSQPGIAWHFLKDMTPFDSLWREPQTVIFDLGNLVNDLYTGLYDVTIDVTFFEAVVDHMRREHRPADHILPLSAKRSKQGQASTFVFPETSAAAVVKLPPKIGRAILTVAATGQAEEEFWWSNVPERAADSFPSSKAARLPAMGSMREVRIYIDGQVAGLAWPFPVVFTGGIAPPLHRPMVGLQVFDMREYEVDVTPWLGYLSDGDEHTISLEVFGVNNSHKANPVFAHVGSNWVLSGKIFAWLGNAELKPTQAPKVEISEIDWISEIDVLDSTAIDYRQSAGRHINVQGVVASVHDEPRTANWTQTFSMVNDGKMRNTAYWHHVNSNYTGTSVAYHGSTPRLASRFAYPISTTYEYKAPQGPNTLELEASLEQGMDLRVTMDSPFATGMEAFLDKRRSSSGAALKATRIGHALFTQGPDGSHGSGTTNQRYELSAMDQPTGDDITGRPAAALYRRTVSVVNETITHDQQRVADSKRKVPTPARGHLHSTTVTQLSAEFAPFPLMRFGGTNVFHRGNGEGPASRIAEGFIDQSSDSRWKSLLHHANRLLWD